MGSSTERGYEKTWIVRNVIGGLCALLMLMGPFAVASAAQESPAGDIEFNIPAQPLGSALNAFAVASGWQVSAASELTTGADSPGVVGQYRPEQALQILLSGTGRTYRVDGPKMITIEHAPAALSVPAAVEPNVDVPPALKSEKPVKVPEIVVKEVRDRDNAKTYVAEDTRTATKTDTPLIATPQSMTVVTRKRMVDQEVNTLAEALRYTAGVHAEPFGLEPRMTFLRFRGFDATTNGLFKNGLQLRNPGFAVGYNLEPYGAERIDVLRGPASFLYGQGSPGGLLNYVSKRPTEETLRELQFLAGNFDRYEGRFDFGGRITDSGALSYRLTGLFRDSGTQIDHVPNGRIFIAPALTWRITSRTAITFLAEYQKDRLGFSQALPVEGTLRVNPNGVIPPHRFTGQPGVDKYNRQEHSVGYELQHRFTDSWNFVQKFRYNSTEIDDVSVFGFAFDPAVDLRTLNRANQATYGKLTAFAIDNQLHGRFSTGPFHHTLLTGVDFQHVNADSRIKIFVTSPIDVFIRNDFGTPVNLFDFSNFNQRTKQLQTGAYIQDQVKYDNWLLTLGGRHDWARNETTDNLTGIRSPQDDSQFTGRAALTYLFESGLAPYVSYSTHFLPSIGLGADGQPFKPETGRQYEAGIKYQPPGTRVFLTAALFDLTRENIVQTDPGSFLPVQRGEARSRGLELEGVGSFDSGVDVIASYTLLDNEIVETTDPVERGKRFPQTPAQFASLWGKYTVQNGVLKGFGIGGGARYIGNTYADVGNTFKVPGFVVGDAMIDYTWHRYRLAVNVSNLFDHEAFGCLTRVATNFCTYGERRTVVGTIAYRW
jgi:iron complex outermembrane recepter protein